MPQLSRPESGVDRVLPFLASRLRAENGESRRMEKSRGISRLCPRSRDSVDSTVTTVYLPASLAVAVVAMAVVL